MINDVVCYIGYVLYVGYDVEYVFCVDCVVCVVIVFECVVFEFGEFGIGVCG